MKLRFIAIGVLTATIMLGGGAAVAQADTTSDVASDTTSSEDAPQRMILRLEPGADADAVVSSVGGQIVEELTALESIIVDVPAANVAAIEADLRIVEATPDSTVQMVESDPASEPTSSDLHEGRTNAAQFVEDGYDRATPGSSFDELRVDEVAEIIGADKVHDRGVSGDGVDVAVIDTGIAPVDGLATVVNGADLSFESQSEELRHLDTNGHGTHLAGIISGLAPDSRLVNVKVGQFDGAADVSQVIAAIDWVVQHRNDPGLNIRVLNLAYGTHNDQSYLLDPLAYAAEVAWRKGIVVVTAAGNGGDLHDGRLTNPAIDPYVLAVGASDPQGTFTTSDDTVAEFSSVGNAERGVDLVAPGRRVVSLRTPGAYLDDEYPAGQISDTEFRGSGTSQSAAVTSAAAALLLDDRPELTPDQVKALLTDTAKDLPRADVGEGAGSLDVHRAMRRAAPDADAVAQSWPTSEGTGTLEGARGTSHVEMDGVPLTGEVDIFGVPWDGTSWSGTSWSGTSWSGGDWNGTSWSGTSWSGTSWSGTSWSGTSWSGTSWSGTSWSGTSWSLAGTD